MSLVFFPSRRAVSFCSKSREAIINNKKQTHYTLIKVTEKLKQTKGKSLIYRIQPNFLPNSYYLYVVTFQATPRIRRKTLYYLFVLQAKKKPVLNQCIKRDFFMMIFMTIGVPKSKY